jgi:hypothetical protein
MVFVYITCRIEIKFFTYYNMGKHYSSLKDRITPVKQQ